mmetsp:Transcript_2952/g.10044  ORF Transcript_2952/g.10044 Transcript_2952/m.10044 type:complete len:80 (+) Transcript_2952:106-345(+)
MVLSRPEPCRFQLLRRLLRDDRVSQRLPYQGLAVGFGLLLACMVRVLRVLLGGDAVADARTDSDSISGPDAWIDARPDS